MAISSLLKARLRVEFILPQRSRMLRDLIRHLPKEPGIYLITNKLNGKHWVGQAIGKEGIYQRCKSHIERFRSGKNSKHLQSAWDKYGFGAFTFEVLLQCPREQCDCWEDYFIDKFKSWDREFGYNLDRKSRGLGRLSEETKARISEGHRGKPGRKWTEEQKKALSEARKGKWGVGTRHSEETKVKMSTVHKGKPKSDLARKRLSESRKGIQIKEETVKRRLETMGKSRWMNDGTKESIVPESQIQSYTENGWKMGRFKQSLDLPGSSFEIS
jgi:group I intron endonuclease